MPLPPATSTPAVTPSQEMVRDLLGDTAPKPPGSRQLISPPAAVLEMAPANVLQGAVRLHGLTSSPTPETQVRVAWAWARSALRTGTQTTPIAASSSEAFMMYLLRDQDVSPPGSTWIVCCWARSPMS